MHEEEEEEYSKNPFEEMPKEVRIISFEISPDMMLDYQAKVQELGTQEDDEEPAIIEMEWNDIEDDEVFRDIMVQVALLGSVDGFRKLEQFEASLPDGPRKQWAKISTLYAQMILEQDLLDEPIGFIVSGLGGEANRIRYNYVLVSEKELSESLVGLISSEIEEIVKNYDAKLEKTIDFGSNYLHFLLLAPYNVDPRPIISELQQALTFLEHRFMESNMTIFTPEEIQSWLNHNDNQ